MENHSNVYEVYMEFESEEHLSAAIRNLRNDKIKVASVNVLKKKTKSQNVIVQASIETGKWMAKNMLFIKIEEQEGLVSVEEL